MTTGNNTTADWIVKSIWLDLAYDEEDPSLLVKEKAGLDLQWLDKPPRETSLPLNGTLEEWFEAFLTLKGIRICDGLNFGSARLGYADRPSHSWNFMSNTTANSIRHQERFDELDSIAKERARNLDAITWRCATAIDHLRSKWDNRKKEEWDNRKKEEWATLLALYHSEVCASASPDISFGVAKRFSEIVPKEARAWELFQAIAHHNVARGQNHLDKALDATRTLDELVDKFEDLRTELIQDSFAPHHGEMLEGEKVLDRFLYFPAILTLAEAYDKLNRQSEQRFYLRTGEVDAEGGKGHSRYWKHRFALQLALLDISLGRQCEDPLSTENLPPRAKALSKSITVDLKLLKRSEIPLEEMWWLLLWDADKKGNLPRKLETTARCLTRLLSDIEADPEMEKEDKKKEKKKSGKEVVGLLTAIRKSQDVWKNEELDMLLSTTADGPSVDRRLGDLWDLGTQMLELVYRLLDIFPEEEGSERTELSEWERPISACLAVKDRFRQVRSEAAFEELSAKGDHSGEDPCRYLAQKDSTGQKECKHEFGHSCAFQTLHQKETGNASKDGKHGGKNQSTASLKYYLSSMAAQQARFLEYLKYRTGRWKRFRQGEPLRQAADFELISLRRWNSFSPNLGSRAANSVGGGYLVRIWAEDRKRYVGIAVDPGYNFLENLFNEGFTIPDIDILVITHAHPDHTENLTNFFTLLRERTKRMKNGGIPHVEERVPPVDHKVLLAMTEGVFERFASHLEAEREFIRDIVVLRSERGRGSKASGRELAISFDPPTERNSASDGSVEDPPCHVNLAEGTRNESGNSTEPAGGSPDRSTMAIKAKPAWHSDGTKHDSIGVEIRFGEHRLGILSDSRYHQALHEGYENCGTIVAHLGGLLEETQYAGFHRLLGKERETFWSNHLHGEECDVEDGKDCSEDSFKRILQKENHLYLPGICRFICDLVPPGGEGQTKKLKSNNAPGKGAKVLPIFVLSEFGEELRGGLRTNLTQRLEDCLLREADHGGGNNCGEKRTRVIPCDVGLRIDIQEGRIFCSICHRYVEPAKISPKSVLPGEEALAYVCEDCTTLRGGELPELLREWCQTGRPVVRL